MATLLLAAWSPAQQDPAPVPAAPSGVTSVDRYWPGMSWALFAGCDGDSDDRLDLTEASEALVGLGDVPDAAARAQAFHHLDLNSDGGLEWPEFDVAYRKALDLSGSFKVRACRPVVPPLDPTELDNEPPPGFELLSLVDGDDDRQLSPKEFRAFLNAAGLDLSLREKFDVFDKDSSGALAVEEFVAVLQFVPGAGAEVLRAAAENPDALPRMFRRADRDRNGWLDRAELDTSLRALDPSLSRWTEKVLADADRSGNGQIGGTEIRHAAENVKLPSIAR
jgi:Ca2+-binding EF-hand superfamily protein